MQPLPRQAANMAGASKAAILRAIQKGRLSADSNDGGGYVLDPAEVRRVGNKGQAGQSGPGEPPFSDAALKVEIVSLKVQFDFMRDQMSDLTEQREVWQKQAETHQRLW